MFNLKIINIFKVLIWVGCLFFLLPASAKALDYYWGEHAQYDRIVFVFSQSIPDYQVQRTARSQITLSLPEDIWANETHPDEVNFSPSTMISRVEEQGSSFEIITTSDSFGFIHFRLADENKVVIDVFYDPNGAKWQPKSKNNETAEKEDELITEEQAEAQKETNEAKTPQEAVKDEQNASREEPAEEAEPEAEPAARVEKNASQGPDQQELDSYYQEEEAKSSLRSDVNRTVLEERDEEKKVKNDSTPREVNIDLKNGYRLRSSIQKVGPDDPFLVKGAKETETSADSRITKEINKTTKRLSKEVEARNQTEEVARQAEPENASQKAAKDIAARQEDLQRQQEDEFRAQQNASLGKRDSENKAAVQNATLNATSNDTQVAKIDKNATNATKKPDFKTLITTARAALANGNIKEAKGIFKNLAANEQLPEELLGKVLYNLADTLLQDYKGNFKEHYRELTDAFERAINFDPESPKVPWGLLNLSLINLRVGNIPEARAYFNILKEKYPNDPNIPVAYVYWGDYHLKNGNYQKAADNYQKVVQDYPEARVAKEAAVGLLEALKELQFYEQAFKIADYIGKRWPRYYVDVPKILRLTGFVALKQEKYDLAREKYWNYYNLVPESDAADVVLARLGDIYLLQGKKEAAKEMYEEVVSKYPDEQGGLIAKMRLAEEGIYDKPKIEDMFTVFDRPFNLRPVKVYKQISQDYPDSPLAPVAQLKLAMWYLFNDKSLDALKAAQEFEKRFAESDLLPRSRQVGRQAFEKLASRAFKEKDFARILDLWNRFSFLQQEQDKLAPETRLAVAMSHWKEGQAQKAISMAKPFLEEGKTDQYAERALDLLLTIYLEQNKWQKIADLENKITKPAWSDKHKAQFKYALALAYENLGDTQKSLPLWKDVAEHKKLTSTQRGYAYYFLAQESMQQDSLEDVNDYAQAAVSELWDTGKDQAKILDCLDWLIEVNRRSGRLQQALRWAREYEKLITKDHPDWPSFRYRYAELYKELGDVQMWEQILRNLQETKPDSFYGRMAASDLENQDLMQQAGQYLNP